MTGANTTTYQVNGGDPSQAGEASSKVKMALGKLGLSPDIIRRASVCMYEGEINMVIHANGGDVTVEIGMDSITITLADTGPGIPDIDRAMEKGYSTAGDVARDLGFGAGMGLSNMKRNDDMMSGSSTVGVDTTVVLTIHI